MYSLRNFSAALIAAVLTIQAFAIGDVEADALSLVWSDEFEVDGKPDTKKWEIIHGDGCPSMCGFGNQEWQAYTGKKRNLRVEDGKLIIEAHKRKKYTSAKITTQKLSGWRYGKISVRAKLPAGIGTWPAIWMLPDENTYGTWPRSGEIDIMEHVGYRQGVVHGTVHTAAYNHKIGTQKGGEVVVADATKAFHVYSVVWNENHILWSVDDTEYYQFKRLAGDTFEEWPFDKPFHLILNLAIGGTWGGKYGVDKKAFPTRLEIDWIRVWQIQGNKLAEPLHK